jgi:hypothetical protein
MAVAPGAGRRRERHLCSPAAQPHLPEVACLAGQYTLRKETATGSPTRPIWCNVSGVPRRVDR